MSEHVPADLIVITVAATRLGVSLDTLREHADSGDWDGFHLDVWRDPKTQIRYFSRAQIESLVVRRSRRFVASRAPIRS